MSMTTPIILPQLLAAIAHKSRWLGQDSFPSDKIWAKEVETWLEFIQAHCQFKRFLPRLRDCPAQRDEALAAIKAAFFVAKYAGYPITEWEPRGRNSKLGEFAFSFRGKEIFCEVKSPGWERAVVESQGVGSSRLQQSKYIPGVEASSFANWPYVRDAVAKAYPKFRSDTSNLLILVDDLTVSLLDDPLGMQLALFGADEGCFNSDVYGDLGAVAALDVCHTGNIEYRFSIHHNPNAIDAVRVPMEAFPLRLGSPS